MRAKTREYVWSLIARRHGRIPPSRVGDTDLGKTIVIGDGRLTGDRPLREGIGGGHL